MSLQMHRRTSPASLSTTRPQITPTRPASKPPPVDHVRFLQLRQPADLNWSLAFQQMSTQNGHRIQTATHTEMQMATSTKTKKGVEESRSRRLFAFWSLGISSAIKQSIKQSIFGVSLASRPPIHQATSDRAGKQLIPGVSQSSFGVSSVIKQSINRSGFGVLQCVFGISSAIGQSINRSIHT